MTGREFAEWLARHRARFPSAFWPQEFTEAGQVFYQGWFRVLKAYPPDLVELASVELQPEAIGHPGQQLPRIASRCKSIAERSRVVVVQPTDPGEVAARARSHGCPECTRRDEPTGHAIRRARGYLPNRDWPMPCWCRCPLGRYLAERNPELQVIDLQAHPELWGATDPRFPTEPTPERFPIPEGIEYLPPMPRMVGGACV